MALALSQVSLHVLLHPVVHLRRGALAPMFQRAGFQTAGGVQLSALQQDGDISGRGLAFQTGGGGRDPAAGAGGGGYEVRA